jgi:4-amino-4-deoxy-L-arabinose transferase-like glycosyltransferase
MMRIDRHLLLALLLAACVVIPRAALVSSAHSETIDDDYHLVRGLEFLRRDPGLIHRGLNDPPLGAALAAVPLWVMGGTTHGPDEGTALHSQSAYTPERALMAVAIWKSLLFLPLIAVAFCWTRRLYGLPAAWLAAGILIVEPTFAGHLHLAALDVIATTGIVIACYLGWRYAQQPTRPRLLAASCATAAALLLKHTAILVPVIQVLYVALAPTDARRTAFRQIPAAILYTALFLWTLLAFDLSPVRKHVPIPAGLYFESVLDAADHVGKPTDGFLNGEVRRGGWWYYFPVVATYKVPLGLAAIGLLAVVSLHRRRPTRDELSLLVPAAAYAAFMMLQGMNIGWRHFLPAYTFLLLLSTRAVAPATDEDAPRRTWYSRLGTPILAGTLLLVTGIESLLRYHPDYLAYTNVSRRDVYLRISESNIDWGQGLRQARGYLDAHPALTAGRQVHVRAFVAANRAVRHYLLPDAHVLHTADPAPRSGLLLVDPVSLSGYGLPEDTYAFLRRVQPVAVIGHSMRVYDLDALRPDGAPR